jgi:hypothetical protein
MYKYLFWVPLFSMLSMNLQGQEITDSEFLFGHFIVSSTHPSLLAKNDSSEIRIITHRKNGSKWYDFFASDIYPEITSFFGYYETPLFHNKFAMGASAGYNHYILRWVHHYPIKSLESSYHINLMSRYRLSKTISAGVRFGYVYKIHDNTVFAGDIKNYVYRRDILNASPGLAYSDGSSTFSMQFDWQKDMENPPFFYRKNALFLNMYASRLFFAKSIVIQPYMFWFSEDLLSSPEIISFFLPMKTGITITRTPVFFNVDFGLTQLASLSAGCMFFNNMLRVSLSYVFYDYYNQTEDLFRKENLNITNIISYKY